MPATDPARRGTTPRPRRAPVSAISRTTAAALPRPAAAEPPLGHRQNGMGDVVVPVANGEIVALPRLWDFGLTEITAEAGILTTDTGLIAVISLHGDSAVVAEVSDASTRLSA